MCSMVLIPTYSRITLIPALDHRGLLPEGIHSGTWQEITAAFGNNAHRLSLIDGAKSFSFNQLSPLHPSPLFLAGSTLSDKALPSDIEATIRIDPSTLTADQVLIVFKLQTSHQQIKQTTNVDFYVTLDQPGANDFTQFFQYVGDKTAAAKGLLGKDKRGLVEVQAWMTP